MSERKIDVTSSHRSLFEKGILNIKRRDDLGLVRIGGGEECRERRTQRNKNTHPSAADVVLLYSAC